MVVVTGPEKASAAPGDAMSSSDAEDDFQEPATPTATRPEQSLPLLPQQFPEVVPLNVGGVHFTTRLSTLRRHEDTMLSAMFSGRHYIPQDAEGRYFIDRDGAFFGDVLNFLRSGDLPPRERVRALGADRGDRQAAGRAAQGPLRQAEDLRLQGGDAHHALRVPALQLAALRPGRRRGQALRAPLRGGRLLRALGGRGRRLRPAALHRDGPLPARHHGGPPVHRRLRQAPGQPLLLQAPHLRVQDHVVVTLSGAGLEEGRRAACPEDVPALPAWGEKCASCPGWAGQHAGSSPGDLWEALQAIAAPPALWKGSCARQAHSAPAHRPAVFQGVLPEQLRSSGVRKGRAGERRPREAAAGGPELQPHLLLPAQHTLAWGLQERRTQDLAKLPSLFRSIF